MTFATAETEIFSPAHEARLADYVALLKPRVMSLVVFTGFAGLLLAPAHLHPFLSFVAVLCIALASGGSGAINMWYERDIDAQMTRTKNRPLPKGRIEPAHALELGAVLIALSVLLMGVALNWLAAGLLAFASAFYIFVYTLWLKRRTPQNIVIGGAAGAFPPMIGWAAATGRVDAMAFVLFALIFFWTPPHFWALALYRSDDYARAGVPMLPVVQGEQATKIQMLAYTLLLLPLSLLPCLFGAGAIYGITADLLGIGFIACAAAVLIEKKHLDEKKYRAARFMFSYSLFYLSVLFAALIADKFVR